MPDISVILCTHNPRPQYLTRALASLRNQTLPFDKWDLIVIDNASEFPLTSDWDVSWHPAGRIIREDELGLTPARLRGIREGTGELLLFIDDDNVLAENYLQTTLLLMAQHPHLAAIGAGQLAPEFEADPPSELIPLLPQLALRTVESDRWTNHFRDSNCIPWGAGLCVRRETAATFRQLIEVLRCASVLGRKGKQLFCGEDDVFSLAATRSGKGFGIFPSLRITHLIPSSRLTRSYFLRLLHDHSFSHEVLRYLIANAEPQRSSPILYVKLLLHGLRRGHFSMRCRLASLRGAQAARRFIASHDVQRVPETHPGGENV